MKLIVGLGNPGPQYDNTRHNVGFGVVDELSKRWSVSLATEKFHGWFGVGRAGGDKVCLLKPTTFMNRSGRAVVAAGRFYKLELADLLIVADDFALPLGKLRIRKKGSAGSHNGLQDIIDRLGSNEWCRLRVGIGSPVGVPQVHVLGRFESDEQAVVRASTERAADAIQCWVKRGPNEAMNRYNGDVAPDGSQ